ncbi:hypothetical protein LCGC14_2760650 [marine sediment metagenome]|uniref:Uncharacterized protein n=1 Tax=marine sediment metagenome TaxID=412755 RepID=A0A0F8YZ10_9ZZZZ
MATLTISVGTTVINTLVDTDAEIQTALRNFSSSIATVEGFSMVPISNTKSKLVVAYTNGDA